METKERPRKIPFFLKCDNTALLSNCGLTGMSQHVSLLGLGGKGCSCCVHGADVDGVELPAPLLAEAQSIDCVISAPV